MFDFVTLEKKYGLAMDVFNGDTETIICHEAKKTTHCSASTEPFILGLPLTVGLDG